ncbi:MAG: ATP-dependent DNA helicase RecG [Candidatus Binataceae bacterium]
MIDPARAKDESRGTSALSASLATVAGVGPKRLEALRSRGLVTFADVLLHLPYRYEDLRRRDRVADLREGMTAVVEGTLHDLKARAMRGMSWRRMTTATLKDSTGAGIRVAWFNLRGDGMMPVGELLLIYGRVTAAANRTLELLHPEVHRLKTSAPPAIRPLYSLPPTIPQRLFATIAGEALTRAARQDLGVPGAIPPELRPATGLPDFAAALAALHQPAADADPVALEAHSSPAHQALALDEMFTFQLALARERARGRRRAGAVISGDGRLGPALLTALPFTLTAAQARAIDEIAADLASGSPMNRILIGDVGSGKTVVAFAAALRTVSAGWQAVMMAPTELLAEQHFRNFNRLCGPLGVTSALLTARLAGAERARILRALQRGDLAVAFGTHALFQDDVRVGRLGLAIIDEQHRFGVFDRARLLALGAEANVLLMTATPIPRSLALALLRNLDVSILDELPPGRTPVTTQLYPEEELAVVDELVRAALERGERVYYVLPLIEGEETDSASVTAAAKRLAGLLGNHGVGVLHGRLRPAEKDRVMRRFRDGELGVLVATTVVEVGVDVPEATLMVIVAAERYGLAQLHQLRGRVGRGAAASRCCLVVSRGTADGARARLAGLAATASGNAVAELDLRTRGPGDLFGTRQTGALPLRFGHFICDLRVIEQAGDLAEEWLRRDPGLASPASAKAVAAINDLMALGFSLGDIG